MQNIISVAIWGKLKYMRSGKDIMEQVHSGLYMLSLNMQAKDKWYEVKLKDPPHSCDLLYTAHIGEINIFLEVNYNHI